MPENVTRNVASLAPETFEESSGGLADDFDGVITEVRYFTRTFDDGKTNLYVRTIIDADGFDEPVEDWKSAGSATLFVPSEDGETETEEGWFALRVGNRKGLNPGSNWAHFISAAIDAGFPADRLADGDIRAFEGVRGHFNRIDQKERKGISNVNAQGYTKQILALTAYEGHEDTAASNGAAVNVDESLTEIVTALLKANNGTLPQTKLPALVLPKAPQGLQGAAVQRCMESEFLSAGPWQYDASKGVLTAASN